MVLATFEVQQWNSAGHFNNIPHNKTPIKK